MLVVAFIAGCSGDRTLTDRNGDGATVLVCLGDSNTDARGNAKSWCERLREERPDWRVVNRSVRFSTVTDAAPGVAPWFNARNQLAGVLAGDKPDGIVLAYGTNDVIQGKPTEQIVDAYRARCDEARAKNVACWVGLAPPLHGDATPLEGKIEELNAALRSRFPRAMLVDFFTDMVYPADFFVDGIHLSDAGQQKRLLVARQALTGR